MKGDKSMTGTPATFKIEYDRIKSTFQGGPVTAYRDCGEKGICEELFINPADKNYRVLCLHPESTEDKRKEYTDTLKAILDNATETSKVDSFLLVKPHFVDGNQHICYVQGGLRRMEIWDGDTLVWNTIHIDLLLDEMGDEGELRGAMRKHALDIDPDSLEKKMTKSELENELAAFSDGWNAARRSPSNLKMALLAAEVTEMQKELDTIGKATARLAELTRAVPA